MLTINRLRDELSLAMDTIALIREISQDETLMTAAFMPRELSRKISFFMVDVSSSKTDSESNIVARVYDAIHMCSEAFDIIKKLDACTRSEEMSKRWADFSITFKIQTLKKQIGQIYHD